MFGPMPMPLPIARLHQLKRMPNLGCCSIRECDSPGQRYRSRNNDAENEAFTHINGLYLMLA